MPVNFAPEVKIENPSKWDIIPIHASDRATFKYCRRQWQWSSPSRLNLVPKAEVHGIRENLWFGTGIHYALQQYYTPLREDPVVAWQTWFNLQWNGGLVSENELDQFYDRQPEPVASTTDMSDVVYRVRGLDELLPSPDVDRYMELLDVGTGMMKFYKDYAEANDNFTVMSTEHAFSVPILDKDGNPLYMVDNRMMPDDWEPDFETENVFGPLVREIAPLDVVHPTIEKQVHARGRMDIILRDNESGRYGVKDYKTAGVIGDDYFKHLDLDEQVTTYLTLGEVEAIIHDLPWKKLEFISYEALLKGYPKPPTITTKGMPSLDRSKETTTAEMFAKAVDQLGIRMIFDKDPKMQSYYSWLVEMGDKRFINRTDKWRNSIQRMNMRIRIYYEALDMLNPSLVCYPNPKKEIGCLNCIFRDPCLQAEDGSDYLETLEMGYEPNWDR